MSEKTNQERADQALKGVEAYAREYCEGNYLQEKMTDLVCDMQHLADANGIDWVQVLRMAGFHYEAEKDEEKGLVHP